MAEIRKNRKIAEKFVLKLFITGASPNSTKAITNIKELCERHIQGRYSLEIIDVYQQPELAKTEDIIALPLLIKRAPLPVRRLIGDMSDQIKILQNLGITA